jgi:hypothetical protein
VPYSVCQQDKLCLICFSDPMQEVLAASPQATRRRPMHEQPAAADSDELRRPGSVYDDLRREWYAGFAPHAAGLGGAESSVCQRGAQPRRGLGGTAAQQGGREQRGAADLGVAGRRLRRAASADIELVKRCRGPSRRAGGA